MSNLLAAGGSEPQPDKTTDQFFIQHPGSEKEVAIDKITDRCGILLRKVLVEGNKNISSLSHTWNPPVSKVDARVKNVI